MADPTPTTREEALALALKWAEGERTIDSIEAAKYAALAAVLPSAAEAPPAPAPPAPFAIDAGHLERQREWSHRTFGPGERTRGVLDHIRKELAEIEADPHDASEWADVIILAFDGAWRAGHQPQAILNAVRFKQERNEARTWPDWRTADTDAAIEHDRSEESPAPPAPRQEGETEGERAVCGWCEYLDNLYHNKAVAFDRMPGSLTALARIIDAAIAEAHPPRPLDDELVAAAKGLLKAAESLVLDEAGQVHNPGHWRNLDSSIGTLDAALRARETK